MPLPARWALAALIAAACLSAQRPGNWFAQSNNRATLFDAYGTQLESRSAGNIGFGEPLLVSGCVGFRAEVLQGFMGFSVNDLGCRSR